MAIIRWWLCLTPLLVRPLFDTVHSCPHLHPYPYPEELELERRELEETEGLVAHEGMARDGTENVIQQQDSSFTSAFNGEEKKRLREREEAETRVATPAQGNATTLSTADFTTNAESKVEYQGSPSLGDEIQAPPSVSEETSAPRRYRFFQRVRATQQTRHEQGREALVADVKEIKKKRLSWRARRALRKAEDRRQRIIKASQDIGRYSLLYQLGSFLMMDRWKETVLVPGKIQPEAYED
ncbi:hypothetical protein BGX28_005033 [Mortierella sp. GBA30]|nr:hypothetical protein BGX28_005033 [Mortierella sp. GBA30]